MRSRCGRLGSGGSQGKEEDKDPGSRVKGFVLGVTGYVLR